MITYAGVSLYGLFDVVSANSAYWQGAAAAVALFVFLGATGVGECLFKLLVSVVMNTVLWSFFVVWLLVNLLKDVFDRNKKRE